MIIANFFLGESDTGNKEISSIVKDFQSKLESAQAELMSERDKVDIIFKISS